MNEKIGDSGVELLRDAGFEVELGAEWEDGEFDRRIGEFDGLLIRSATKVTADVIEKADNLRAIGRAGVGVDNVDVDAATKRGVVVANAPQSNVVTAAEHTMALLTALARNVPQAHAVARGGPLGPLQVQRRGALRQDPGHHGLRPHRPARGRARPRVRHARPGLRRLRGRGALPRARRRARRLLRPGLRRGGLHHRPSAQDARDRELAGRRGLREDEGRRAHPQRCARAAGGRRGPGGRPGFGQGRRRRAGRVPLRADHRPPAVRQPQGHRDARTWAHPPPRPPTAPATRPPSRSWPR